MLKNILMAPVNWVKVTWLKLFRDSETLFWAFVQAAGGAAVYFWDNPVLREAVQNMFQPKYAPFVLVGMGVVTLVARLSRAKDL